MGGGSVADYFRSPGPFGVAWQGWLTDTLRLQQAGWRLAVERDAYSDRYRLLMHHDGMSLYAVTHQMHIDRALHYAYRREVQIEPKWPTFVVNHVSSCMRVLQMTE